jgi:glycine/sarcosine N-methyltransferase
MDEYKILAEIYDILNPREDVYLQKSFFEELSKKYSVQSVLDCACGTGIHLSMFHDMGLTCFGSDISPEMLRVAKDTLAGTNVLLKEQDFRDLSASWHDTYDMITCLTTSLPYMLTQEDLVVALNSMYEKLNPGGILVISNGITDSLLDAKPKFIPARINQNDAFYFICEYDADITMTFNILYVKKGEESMEHAFTSTTYNAMRKSVLKKAFEQTQFQDIQYYGDYDFNEYSTETSNTLIVVAVK